MIDTNELKQIDSQIEQYDSLDDRIDLRHFFKCFFSGNVDECLMVLDMNSNIRKNFDFPTKVRQTLGI